MNQTMEENLKLAIFESNYYEILRHVDEHFKNHRHTIDGTVVHSGSNINDNKEFENVEESIKPQSNFETNYQQILRHVDENGRLSLPHNNKETNRLAAWLSRQRGRKSMSEEERRKMEILESYSDFDMAPRQEKNDKIWKENFQKLLTYRQEYHTFVISKKDTKRLGLSNWVDRQRRMARQGSLSQDRREALRNAGFQLEAYKPQKKTRIYTESQEAKWKAMYAKLCEFKQQHGHCEVGFHDDNNPALGYWVSLQRVTNGKGLMDASRKALLDQIQFTWRIQSKSSSEEEQVKIGQFQDARLQPGYDDSKAAEDEQQQSANRAQQVANCTKSFTQS